MIRVLVVDDEALIRTGFQYILDIADGIEVVAAVSGGQAVHSARELRPDVVLLDIRMPDVDGLTVLAALRRLAVPPVVAMLTTFDMDQYVAAALRSGAAGFLLKDTDPAQLPVLVRTSGSRPTELTPQPSLADLQRLVDTSGIEAELCTEPADDLPPAVQRAVYRTVQEALTNVRKHAPGATAVIRVHHEDGTVRATIANTAPTRPALPLPGAHHGLVGLRQRAELLGGTVTSGPSADGGYELCLELPVQGAP
ncbi:response regulator [Streptomyces sp. NPDC002838]|uniref:response regulator n=1 Tax=Streptomyces sp. NPDC002838 TaxID=3154436 RepID=UPI00331B767B